MEGSTDMHLVLSSVSLNDSPNSVFLRLVLPIIIIIIIIMIIIMNEIQYIKRAAQPDITFKCLYTGLKVQ